MATLAASPRSKRAVLYRMVMPEHVCPFGLKARWLLKHKRFEVEDHWLTSRAEQETFKAVYLDRRDLKCACVGGSSNVPLGFVSLTENVMMVAMAIGMGVALL